MSEGSRQLLTACATVAQKFLMQPGVPPETALRVYRRYLRLEPMHAEEYIAYLKTKACTPIMQGDVNTCARPHALT